MAVILWGGYVETMNGRSYRRIPGDVLFRRATDTHNVVTSGVNWSLVITNRKTRDWGYVGDASCRVGGTGDE